MTKPTTSTAQATKELRDLIIEGIQDRKGKSITVIDLSDIEGAAASSFIIAQGTSTMHVASVADSVREYLETNASKKPYNYDGYKAGEWIVLDYGDTLVHIFMPEARDRYNLEELWNDAKITEIPDLN